MIQTNLIPASNHEVESYLEKELQLTSQQRDLMFYNEVLRSSPFKFYKRRPKPPTSILWRLTMPFFFIFYLLILAAMPVRFMLVGKWYYDQTFLDRTFHSWAAKIGV